MRERLRENYNVSRKKKGDHKEIEEKNGENKNDTYHYLRDEELSPESKQNFSTFLALKKFVFERPKLSEKLIEKYHFETGNNPIDEKQILKEFIDYTSEKMEKYPILRNHLLRLFERINENNEIEAYVKEKLKNTDFSHKELVESIFGTVKMIKSMNTNQKKGVDVENTEEMDKLDKEGPIPNIDIIKIEDKEIGIRSIDDLPEELRPAHYAQTRVIEPEKLESIIRKCSGEEGVKSVENYIAFIKLVKENPTCQKLWYGYYKKNRPFDNRLWNFRKHLMKNGDKSNDNIMKLIDVLGEIGKKNEIHTLLDILEKKSSVKLKHMEPILLAERGTLQRKFKDQLGKEKYTERFPNLLRLYQKVHKNMQNLMTKVFSEHSNLGKIYHEVRLFKAENDFRVDSVITPSDELKDFISKKYGLGQIDYILIDYTSNLDNDYILEKIAKYQPKHNGLLWIVGTKWIFSENRIQPPATDLFEIKLPNRIMIMSMDEFADNLKLNQEKNPIVFDNLKKLEHSTKIDDLESVEATLKKYKKMEKSTDEFMADLGIETDQKMFKKYGNYDPAKIYDIIIELRKSKDYRPDILSILNRKGSKMTLELRDSLKEKVDFKPKIMKELLKSLESKNLIKKKLSYDENGQRENIYWLVGQEEPMSRYELIEGEIVKDFNQGTSEEEIRKKFKIGTKYLNTIKKNNNLDRPDLSRKKVEHCNIIIRDKWNWDFLNLVLENRLFKNFKKIATFEIDGRTYFDEKAPLKQDQVVMSGKSAGRQSILENVKRVDRQIKSIFCDLALKIQNSSIGEKNLRLWAKRYTLNQKDKFTDNYQFEDYFSDFKKYIFKSLDTLDTINKYVRIACEEIDLVKFGEKRRVKPSPNSDTAKIIQWFKDDPKFTKEKARTRARKWIKDRKMSMKLGSVHNVVNQSYNLFLEGEKLTLHEKIQKLLGSLTKENRQEITEEDLKKDPEFSMYNLDILRSYLNKYRKDY